ncbi:MAG TPA: hypothetical protein VF898_10450 [Chloroflexota bacterium]
MWAQIVKSRMKPEADEVLSNMQEQMRGRMAQRSGLVNSFVMRNRNDPQEMYVLIVFESEEQARQGEKELEHDPFFQQVRSVTEGTPEYVDLDVLDRTP